MPLRLENPRKGKTQFYRIRGAHLGIRVDRSLGVSDKRLAEKILRETIRKIEDDAKRGFDKPPGKPFYVGIKTYLASGGQNRFLAPLMSYFGEKPLEEITQEIIDEAAVTIYPQATAATRNRQVYSPISAILKANRISLLIARPKGANGKARTFFFQPGEVERLLTAATKQDPEFGLFLMFLLYTGLRLSEGLSLKVRDLSLPEGRAFIETTKNGLPRTVHLPAPLVAALANHPRGYDREGRVFRFSKCSRLYKRLQMAAGASNVMIPEGVSFHAFRHTYGAFLRRYGNLDTSGLVASGAWKSHDAARRYEHVDVSSAAKASDLFPSIQIFDGGELSIPPSVKKSAG